MRYKVPFKPELGNEPAIVADRRRRPDRRQVSARWLAGTLLTGLTSSALMGIALSGALDGHRNLVTPAAAATGPAPIEDVSEKGTRVYATAVPITRSRQTIELSTMTREGDREVIRTLPFAYVSMALAARHPSNVSYPAFNALKVFSEGEAEDDGADGTEAAQIYGARVESQISLKVEPFTFDPAGTQTFFEPNEAGDDEIERMVHAAAPNLSDEPIQVASLEPVDPSRFSESSDAAAYEPGSAFRVIEENVSISMPDSEGIRYQEEIIPFRETKPITGALADSGYQGVDALNAAQRLTDLLGTKVLDSGNVIRVGAAMNGDTSRVVRLSVYRGVQHILTVAETDDGRFEPASEPTKSAAVNEAFDESATETPRRADMPTAYDGIYQAALAYGLNERLCGQLIHMLASEVDYQSRLSPSDRLTVFYSLEEGQTAATDASEILYVEARFGNVSKRYYRFRGAKDDRSDYYDEEGRSSRQFLLRSPVPNGRFTSPFGTRRHPVLGYSRPHWGVDWAAPSGTPILAAGSGTVEEAGWTSGYGRQTLLRHANGYETSYSHQSGIAKGVVKGATVRQGQVIGYVGSTGLSTGNHLHYEVSVNGQKVDPMRIRLPSGKALDGEELEVFKRERDRIDELLKERADAAHVASR
ncbi:peptidase M23 [Aureimonas sp. Leaf454]|uniref:M23 family metallopeptidase n=1 Tax=Aureimonas sp. Leaf454 TaxID=1736381 RepID=UPI0006FC4871|nr:M23 family metallopeptidase [Aureimonas sp. Leaf454]KQT44351.1 peptidase M23 [Aureimonas sp. Leaf454]